LTRDRQYNDELYLYRLSNPHDAPDWACKEDQDDETNFEDQNQLLNKAVEPSMGETPIQEDENEAVEPSMGETPIQEDENENDEYGNYLDDNEYDGDYLVKTDAFIYEF
jgi:hypothetical protein